jgi:hypothetical protein
MTVFALSLAVGRVIPELAETSRRWPYLAAGVIFALYGIALIGYGSLRRRAVDRALDEGRFPSGLGASQSILVGGGVLLGVLTVLLVLLG